MGTVTIDFVGLFLFDNRYRDRKRVAVIDASRSGYQHQGVLLRPHEPFILVEGNSATDWPHNGDRYELSGQIAFSLAGRIEDDSRWVLPKMATACALFRMNPSFFDEPRVNETHAIIDLRCGTLLSWRYEAIERSAFVSRVTIRTNEPFSMRRGDGRHIDFPPDRDDARITFRNTELIEVSDDFDWLWYYAATGNSCYARPDDTGLDAERNRGNPQPYTLGCSNSNWP